MFEKLICSLVEVRLSKTSVLRDQEATTYLPRRATAAGCDVTETGFPWLGDLRG
jgi:hypothetical protein